jgi:hypothetical protein
LMLPTGLMGGYGAMQFNSVAEPIQFKRKTSPVQPLEGQVGLSALGQGLRTNMSSTRLRSRRIWPLIEQLNMDAHLQPASIVTAVVYSLLLASGLIAHALGFPKFSTEPRATPFVSINVPAPLASDDGTIGYR